MAYRVSPDGRFSESMWESYVENNSLAAYRVFWHDGPDKDEITVVAMTPHPSGMTRTYGRIRKDSFGLALPLATPYPSRRRENGVQKAQFG